MTSIKYVTKLLSLVLCAITTTNFKFNKIHNKIGNRFGSCASSPKNSDGLRVRLSLGIDISIYTYNISFRFGPFGPPHCASESTLRRWSGLLP